MDPTVSGGPLIGVLALQGDFEAHRRVLEGLGARVREVRVVADLVGIAGLVIPGGESTTITLGVAREGLAEPIRALAREGLPVLGSCAGLIMLDRAHLGLMDIVAERNAFGRQIRSFEADVEVAGLSGGPVHGVFIRAPWIAEHGPGVEILGEVEGHPVVAREGHMLAIAFHTELGKDDRLHGLFLEWANAAAGRVDRHGAAEGASPSPD
ncbi:MAG TPA: pyridoxal 5'-phosphate synthase glutaminase subunit PdxT [Solirubrobacteraceae bacterium]|nr:pyridoxal 5'-phosphate synthase glutaminase subunit PdxT [Solirubrobacteraceae bacterium]